MRTAQKYTLFETSWSTLEMTAYVKNNKIEIYFSSGHNNANSLVRKITFKEEVTRALRLF